MGKMITLGDMCFRLDQIDAFTRAKVDVTDEPDCLAVWVRHSAMSDYQGRFIIRDPGGMHYEKLARAMETL